MQNDFLSALRRRSLSSTSDEAPAEQFFFQIVSSPERGAVVRLVDAEGKSVRPRGRVSDPAVAAALALFLNPDKELLGWDEVRDEIALADFPQLSFILVQCPNVKDSLMRPVSYDSTPVRPMIVLSQTGERITPSFKVADEDGDMYPMSFLTDSLVLAGTVMSPCTPVGEGFRYAPQLLAPFDASMVEAWLSVVLSALHDIGVVYGSRRVIERTDETEPPRPGLIFEKVDFDKALFLRVMAVIPGVSPELSADFDLTTIAKVTEDSVYLRRVHFPDLNVYVKEFDDLLNDTFTTARDRNAIYRDGSLYVFPEAQASTFLLRMLPRLVREYTVLGAEKLKEFRIQASQPKLNVRLGSGIDYLEGEATVELGDQTFSLAELLKRYSRNKYVELSNGSRVIVEDSYIKQLERIFRVSDDPEKPGEVQVSFFDIPALERLLGDEGRPEFAHSRKFYEGLRALPQLPYEAPEGLHGELRPYQKEGVKWMRYLGENGFGGCLADDMGLGKTIQTISLLTEVCSQPGAGPVLIVMPRSLLFNWKSEIERFAPGLTATVYHGLGRDFGEALKSQIVLTTYAMVRNDLKNFMDVEWEYIILDESQNIKNLNAQSTRAVLALKGRKRLALSGTPMENNLQELYSLFRFLNPGMFGSLEDFNVRYGGPIQRECDPEAMESLRRKIFPFILRRLKRDVLHDLPDRVDETLYVEMEPDHRKLYENRRLYYKEAINEKIARDGVGQSQIVMFQALNELRQIASVPEVSSDGAVHSPKLELLVEQVSQSVANGHKVVVFFNFIAGLELAAEQLRAAGIKVETMTGSTTHREPIVRRFQNSPDCQVLLMTIKVGGVGLNLTAADIVYIFEPWWNKAAEEQAVNRLHRIGQKATVFSFAMITHDTIEEKIRLLQKQKAELFDELISTDSSMSKSLTEEDINFILS